MNSVYDCVTSVAQRANRYNLDDLLKVMVEWNNPEEVRNDLLAIYFCAAQAVFNDGCSAGTLADSFTTMQEIIEALATTSDTTAARLAVTVK